jgi:hypothetical protein
VVASVAADGSLITMSSTSSAPLVVLGYSGEPFVRIAGGHVFDNVNSLTTYATAPGVLGSIPTTAGHGPVRWHRVAAGSSYSWIDQRLVWSGSVLPAAVMTHPKQPHVVSHWSIPVRVAGASAAITGRIDWTPPTDSVALTAVCVLGFLVVVLAAAALAAFPQRRPRRRRRGVTPGECEPTGGG